MTTPIHGYLTAVVHKQGQKPRYLAKLKHNLLTDNGRDVFYSNIYTNATSGTRGFNYIALTESTITPAAGNTSLTGEIATNGLDRASSADSTKSHSAGTNTGSIEKTFTATGSFTDVKASATFNASSGVTMGHIATFATGSGTLAANDTLKVTWTFNMTSS